MAKKTKSKLPPKEKPEGYTFGRPTDYKKEYCQMLIEHMSEGLSFESFGGVIDCDKATLYRWLDAQSDFSNAKAIGRQKSLIFWEKQGVKGLFSIDGISLNPTVYRLNMINRFAWKDKAEEEKKIEIQMDKLTDEELLKIVAEAVQKPK